ncbi:hypothetical protein EXIGLDRAFT_561804, partial [Exidia glandulosa HHB12029]
LDGGDTIHARALVPLRHDSRDASFIRYTLDVAHRRSRTSEFVMKVFFGQLLRIFVLPLPALPAYDQPEQRLLLAEIKECNGLKTETAGGVNVIDLASIECLIGRIHDRGRWAVVDRS